MKERQDDEISLHGDSDETQTVERTICRIPRGTFFVCGSALVLAVVVIIISVFLMHSALPTFHESLDLNLVMTHLEKLQAIADENKGSRGLLHGYNDSVDYFMEVLETKTKFAVEKQQFPLKAYQVLKPSTLVGFHGENVSVEFDAAEFRNMMYSGSGVVKGVPLLVGNHGCEESDYPPSETDVVHLVHIGGCSMTAQAQVAHKVGVKALLIITENVAFTGTLGQDFTLPVIVMTVSKALGLDILYLSQVESVEVSVSSRSYPTVAWNLLATTNAGSEDNVIVVGASLESVDNGPGINDNGSGASTLLTIATSYSGWEAKSKNKLVFAFWGGEVSGHVGSTYFLEQLKKQNKLSKVAAYINLAVLASPNYIRGVYDASETPAKVRKSSEVLQKMFEAHYKVHDMDTDLITFDGISGFADSGPFLDRNIPAGGVTAGAEDLKTMEQRKKYGGIANVAFDPCFHHKCDSIENINEQALDELARGAANIIYELSMEEKLRETLGNS